MIIELFDNLLEIIDNNNMFGKIILIKFNFDQNTVEIKFTFYLWVWEFRFWNLLSFQFCWIYTYLESIYAYVCHSAALLHCIMLLFFPHFSLMVLMQLIKNKKSLISKRQITTMPCLRLEFEMEGRKILYPKCHLL